MEFQRRPEISSGRLQARELDAGLQGRADNGRNQKAVTLWSGRVSGWAGTPLLNAMKRRTSYWRGDGSMPNRATSRGMQRGCAAAPLPGLRYYPAHLAIRDVPRPASLNLTGCWLKIYNVFNDLCRILQPDLRAYIAYDRKCRTNGEKYCADARNCAPQLLRKRETGNWLALLWVRTSHA